MPDNLYLSALRTQSLPFRIEEYVNFRIVDIANDTIVKAIRDEATLKNMPDRYINNIHSEFDGGELWIWVDFKGKKGEPLDLFFEEGTKRHFIKPVLKKALRWFQGGVKFFSKGHYVSGIEARHIFREGLKKGYPEFKKTLTKDLEKYLEETSLFG
jgi:hypothetical protein